MVQQMKQSLKIPFELVLQEQCYQFVVLQLLKGFNNFSYEIVQQVEQTGM